MDVQKLFAARIGGEQFGKVQQTFKFTLIDNAKKAFKAANPGVKVIDMGVGEPDEIPSEAIIQRLFEEAKKKENRIYPCNGILPFQEAAAEYISKLIDVNLTPATEIVHCIGTKSALAQIPLAFLNPGESVISTVPGYPVMPKIVEWLGGKNIPLMLKRENGFLPDLQELESKISSLRPKMVLLNYPNNPTGGLATRDFFEKIVALAHKYTFLIVQDAAYADFVFNGEFVSPLQMNGGKEVTLELYSLSKSYNMQGYRLGFVAGSAELVKAFALVKDNTDNGQFIAIQKAGIEALDNGGDILKYNKDKYLRRMKKTVEIFNQAGICCELSPGTFYLYVDVPESFRGEKIQSAQNFADLLISKFGLISVPWNESGEKVRFSMTFEVQNADFESDEILFGDLARRLDLEPIGKYSG